MRAKIGGSSGVILMYIITLSVRKHNFGCVKRMKIVYIELVEFCEKGVE